MRLTCPNCGAQYEVPPEAIPAGGRDVQCSNCAHLWFEGGDAADAVAAVPLAENDDEEADDLAEAEAWEAESPPPPPTSPPPRPTVSPAAAEILRAEAAREAAQRSRDEQARAAARPAGPERAPPAPPPPAPPPPPASSPERHRAEEARQRMARLRGEAGAASSALTRRDRLPDIEEINSTLRSSAERTGPGGRAGGRTLGRGGAAAPRPGAGRGLRTGFALALLVVAVLALLYAFAPRIVAAVPAAGVVVRPVVAAVDEARQWLDGRVAALRRLGGEEPQAPAGPAVESPGAPAAAPSDTPPPAEDLAAPAPGGG